MNRPTVLTRLAFTLLVLLLFVSSINLFRKALQDGLGYRGDNRITAYGRRFEGILDLLPSHGVVGYLGDDQESGGSYEVAALAVSQYVLAPLLLERSTEHDIVLGNFNLYSSYLKYRRSENYGRLGLVIERDLGDGLILYRRKSG